MSNKSSRKKHTRQHIKDIKAKPNAFGYKHEDRFSKLCLGDSTGSITGNNHFNKKKKRQSK